MKKLFSLAATAVLGAALLLGGCGSTGTSSTGSDAGKTLKIGASPVPHAEILEQVKPILAKEGIKLEIVEFSDYVQPNVALNDKELDANFFAHIPYQENFNKEKGTHIATAGAVHIEPMGIYSKKVKDLKEVQDGAQVAIPSDATNGGRALLLLSKAGLITLNDPNSISATVQDIKDNPKNLKFVELEAAQLPRALDDSAISVINTNFALGADLNPTKDALFLESKDSPYVNIVSVREGDEKRDEIVKLIKALQSPEIKKFIEDKYKGAILPAF